MKLAVRPNAVFEDGDEGKFSGKLKLDLLVHPSPLSPLPHAPRTHARLAPSCSFAFS